MQTLDLAGRLSPAVLNGQKRATIRWVEPPVVPGPLRLVCSGDPSRQVVVEVCRVTAMALREAAGFLGRRDDWPDRVMLAGMREHDPAIRLDDAVQVIEFRLPGTGPD